MKIALAQINPTVGQLIQNKNLILQYAKEAKVNGADLAVFPELCLVGYPPKDLLFRSDFLKQCKTLVEDLSQETPLALIIGAPTKEKDKLFNSALFCHEGKVQVIAKKILLPNYNVFDEKRYFEPNAQKFCSSFQFLGKTFLISICEDAWNSLEVDHQPKYSFDPIEEGMKQQKNIDLILNLSASPFSRKKPQRREKIFSQIASRYHTPLLVAGTVGAHDQILFDGHSMVVGKKGEIEQKAPHCSTGIIYYDTFAPKQKNFCSRVDQNDCDDLIFDCLLMGIKNYFSKCRLSGAVIGLSGGIDSAVVFALLAKALGRENVSPYFLPSKFSSDQSRIDAEMLANNLSIELTTIGIEDVVENMRNLIFPMAKGASKYLMDLCDQNIQARVRGLFLTGIANASDKVLVSTSNKSELAVGFTTIYGDMCGAFSPLGDLYKSEVFKLAALINRKENIFPKSILEKPPSAELKPGQSDEDTLGTYDTLDPVLKLFIEEEKSVSEICALTKQPKERVEEIIRKVDISEFKRRQAPFALMVSDNVFGDARRQVIAKGREF